MKCNIFYFCETDPRETKYGGQQRTHIIWRGLKSLPGATVVAIVSVPHPSMESSDAQEGIYKICLYRRYSPGWLLSRVFHKLIPEVPTALGLSAKRLFRVVPSKPDIVVSRYLRPAGMLKLWRLAPLYVDVDDTPTADFLSRNQGAMGLWKRVKFGILKIWQDRVCSHAKLLWVPNAEQIAELKKWPVAVLPNIPLVDEKTSRNGPRPQDKVTLGFVGYLAHEPNYRALNEFFKTCWAEVRSRHTGIEFLVAGGGLPDFYKKEWGRHEGVTLLGFVDDLSGFYGTINAFVAPMLIGSGTCIKVLEALGYGCPVISKDFGLRGIAPNDRTDANGIYVYDSIDSLNHAIAQIATRMGDRAAGARLYIQKNFSFESVSNILQQGILSDKGIR